MVETSIKFQLSRQAISKVTGVGVLVLLITTIAIAYVVVNQSKPNKQTQTTQLTESTTTNTATATYTTTSSPSLTPTSTSTTSSQPPQIPQDLLSEGLTPVQGADKIKIVGYQVYYTIEEEEHNYFLRLHIKLCANAQESGAMIFYAPNGKEALHKFFEAGEGITCHTYVIGGYNATLQPGTWKIVFIDPLNNKTEATWYWDVKSRNVKINWIKVEVVHTDGTVAFTKFQVSLTNNGNVPTMFKILYHSDKPHTFPIAGPWSTIPPHTTKVFTVVNEKPVIGIPYEKTINGYFELRLPGGPIKIPYALTPPPMGQTTTVTVRP